MVYHEKVKALQLKQFVSEGFSLVEVLVALVIFSTGLLGLIQLHMNALMLQNDSQVRATASLLVADMADRIRANPAEALLGTSSAYNNPDRSIAETPACLGLSDQGAENDSSCDATAMALFDFYEWQNLIAGSTSSDWHPASAATLPSASGVVCIDSTPEDGTPATPACDGVVSVTDRPVYAIKLWWTERKDSGSTLQQHTMSVSP